MSIYTERSWRIQLDDLYLTKDGTEGVLPYFFDVVGDVDLLADGDASYQYTRGNDGSLSSLGIEMNKRDIHLELKTPGMYADMFAQTIAKLKAAVSSATSVRAILTSPKYGVIDVKVVRDETVKKWVSTGEFTRDWIENVSFFVITDGPGA